VVVNGTGREVVVVVAGLFATGAGAEAGGVAGLSCICWAMNARAQDLFPWGVSGGVTLPGAGAPFCR
jgi:hypothetical protein